MNEAIFDQIKACPYDIYIWGAGSMAKEVKKRLDEHDIKVKGYFVDEKEKSMDPVGEQEILKKDWLINNKSEIAVVCGHGHYENIEKLREYKLIRKIFVIVNPYLQYQGPDEKWMYNNRERISKALKKMDCLSAKCLLAYYKVQKTGDIKDILDDEFVMDNIFSFFSGRFTENEIYVDIGAYTGDTINLFLKACGEKYKKIIAIEPNLNAYMCLEEFASKRNNIITKCCGLGKKNETMYINLDDMQSAHVSNNTDGVAIEIYKFDDLMKQENITMVKIFVPFMAMDILEGARESILKFKPKLIIYVGADNGTHILDVIEWIDSLSLGYKVCLRYDFPMPTRLAVYAYIKNGE